MVVENTSQKNQRIALNTLYLYLRMIFVVCINLYTSRLVLQYLGVKDFGIYNIIGEIVALMMFVNSTMRGATSRFISYSIGQNKKRNIERTISSAIQVHIIIAFSLLSLVKLLDCGLLIRSLIFLMNLCLQSTGYINFLYLLLF